MANYTGPNIPETDTTPIPILLPRNRRYDQQPTIYVVTVFDDLPSTSPRVEVTPISPGYGAGTPLLPPNTPPTDPYIHPAYYTSATGTIPSKAEAVKEAESEQTAPEQEPHCPAKKTTEPSEEKTPTDFTTLAKLLDEIYQARHCPRCRTTPQAKTCPKDSHSSSSFCYYHRQFGRSALKCRSPCSLFGQHQSSTQ